MLRLYFKIRQFFQPYYTPNPKWLAKIEKNVEVKEKNDNVKDIKYDTDVRLLKYPKPLDRAIEFKKKPKLNDIWYYHDMNRHQVFGHFPKDAYKKYTTDKRSDGERKKLQPLLYPKQDKPFDRTHLIPFGYHGLENDNILVVGWDSDQNRNELADFESKQRILKQAIYWHTDIRRVKGGAVWRYMVFSEQGNLLDMIKINLDSEFVWKD